MTSILGYVKHKLEHMPAARHAPSPPSPSAALFSPSYATSPRSPSPQSDAAAEESVFVVCPKGIITMYDESTLTVADVLRDFPGHSLGVKAGDRCPRLQPDRRLKRGATYFLSRRTSSGSAQSAQSGSTPASQSTCSSPGPTMAPARSEASAPLSQSSLPSPSSADGASGDSQWLFTASASLDSPFHVADGCVPLRPRTANSTFLRSSTCPSRAAAEELVKNLDLNGLRCRDAGDLDLHGGAGGPQLMWPPRPPLGVDSLSLELPCTPGAPTPRTTGTQKAKGATTRTQDNLFTQRAHGPTGKPPQSPAQRKRSKEKGHPRAPSFDMMRRIEEGTDVAAQRESGSHEETNRRTLSADAIPLVSPAGMVALHRRNRHPHMGELSDSLASGLQSTGA